MIGGNGAGILVLVIIALYASAVVALLLSIVGVILFFLKRKRASITSFILAFALILFWASLYLWIRPPSPKDYTVSFSASPELAFAGLPGGRVMPLGSNSKEHQIWGHLKIDITLPDGKKIQGTSERVFVTTADSRIKEITLFYSPTTQDSAFHYWKDGGHLARFSSYDNIRVDRGLYSVELFSTKDSGYRIKIEMPPSKLSKIQG
jgi:hypothetical protein